MAKRNTKQKKLTSMILLLFLTIVMLVTATYAWFTANQTVTVQSLDVKVEARNGLMVSVDGFEWKTVVTNTEIVGAKTGYYGAAINQIPEILEAVSSAGRVGTNGYLDIHSGVIGIDDNGGDFTIESTRLSETDGNSGYYIAFDLFLRSDLGGQIYLSNQSSVVPKEGADDKGLQNSARVAFVTMGNTASDSPVATIQGLNNTANSVMPANTSYIWEPNFDTHSSHGVVAAAEVGITTTQTGATRIPYDGILAPITTAIKLNTANETANPTYFSEVIPDIITSANFATETLYKPMFVLDRGVTKVRIYMWIEGQDIDCENNASGTDISFNLQFSTSTQETP